MNRLVQQRGFCKAQITRAHATVHETVEGSTSVETLEYRLSKLNSNYERFIELSEHLCTYKDEPDYVDPITDLAEYEDKHFNTHSVLTQAIRQRRGEPNSPKLDTTAFENSVDSLVSTQAQFLQKMCDKSSRTELHLEKIKIPTFSGHYEDWRQFYDMFVGSIDKRANLTNCQKFHYLKSYLEGEALNLVKHISITEENYTEALERLVQRYDKKPLIARSFISNYLALPNVTASSATALRKVVDGADEAIRGLKALNCNERDPWLIHILLSKLDSDTRQFWAESKDSTKDELTIYDFFKFLFARCDALESCQPTRTSIGRRQAAVHHADVNQSRSGPQCAYCKESHTISSCVQFKSLDISTRRSFVKTNKLCFNCLSRSHVLNKCTSNFTCRICGSKHHTLVHSAQQKPPYDRTIVKGAEDHSAPASPKPTAAGVIHHTLESADGILTRTILPTILANVIDAWGNTTTCRILLDTGSTITLATEAFIQRIGASRTHARISVVGLATSSAGVTKGRARLQLISRTSSNSVEVTALIMSSLTSSIPAQAINTNSSTWEKICQLPLADPSFGLPGAIDVIIGSDQLWNLCNGERKSFGNYHPVAINTFFGWVIAGSYNCVEEVPTPALAHHAHLDLDELVRSFMEMDSVQPSKATIDATDPVEQHFVKTHKRNNEGAYMVQYPFKNDAPPFGATLPQAIVRLSSLERKMRQSPELRQQYLDFMDDYLRRGHMELLPPEQIDKAPASCVYLAHHAVLKPESSTTKCRVVFDGSGKDSTGISLNDRLQEGPPIQRDLIGVCLRFRQHRYVLCADIEKMFRGIFVDPEHTNYRRIVWRTDESSTISHYRLLTVTYGLAPSPFLAVRVLKQLADEYQSSFPLAACKLSTDAYVDDIATGCDSVEELFVLKDELIQLLGKAKFKLRKWSSNCWPLLKSLGPDLCEYKPVAISDRAEISDSSVKILGQQWDPCEDALFIKFVQNPSVGPPTKRGLLSELSKIYDPLGLFAPATVLLKILFQESWLSAVEWDEELPGNICARWQTFITTMPHLSSIRIPRYIASQFQTIELHGFADASLHAYGAVVYSRVNNGNSYVVTLIAAKTRVAPVKPISIPRLELNAAHLLTKLLTLIKSALTIPIASTYCWSDSEVVLHWLSAPPPRTWNTYVCNRAAEILEVYPRSCWQHVRTDDNPADCASRGLLPSKLAEHQLWWDGPPWLTQPQSAWPPVKGKLSLANKTVAISEKKSKTEATLHVIHTDNSLDTLMNKISSWSRLLRVICFCFRFINRSRRRLSTEGLQATTFLTSTELKEARNVLIQRIQRKVFSKEYHILETGSQLQAKSKLLRFTPFIDENGLMRVGGRLGNSSLNYNAKHPILIPKESTIATLLLRHIHVNNLHSGVDATFHIARQQYWILGARNLVRKIAFRCKTCFMQRRATSSQIMANLPVPRVQPLRCFRHTGLDYAGPVSIKLSTGRTPKIGKAWFAIFVCLSTKALHIEVVSDLTTQTFIAAFRRFWSRRGPITDLYSDNGTTFQGAKKKLDEMRHLAISHCQDEMLADFMSSQGITWHFIPPSPPHFGGIWESNVRSIKLHLRRVVGDTVLTFEEYSTILSQIESILNSRPLCPLSDTSLDPLTPAHFLIGEPHTSVPEPSLLDVNINRLQRWSQLQAMVQGFWKRWHLEYITSLQPRNKWQLEKENVVVGTLCVLKEPNLPPTKWLLGRITEIHAGSDNKVRVVTVQTARGIYKRPLVKIAILPLF